MPNSLHWRTWPPFPTMASRTTMIGIPTLVPPTMLPLISPPSLTTKTTRDQTNFGSEMVKAYLLLILANLKFPILSIILSSLMFFMSPLSPNLFYRFISSVKTIMYSLNFTHLPLLSRIRSPRLLFCQD